jgi:hypothetical protein
MSALDLIARHGDAVFEFGGHTYRFERAAPVSDEEIAELAEKMVPKLPADYVAFIKEHGYADVFGAKLHRPLAVTRMQGDDWKKPAQGFVQFAKREPLLFTFHVMLDIVGDLGDRSRWPEATGVMLIKGETLAGSFEYAPMGKTFTDWVQQVIAMSQMRAAQAKK